MTTKTKITLAVDGDYLTVSFDGSKPRRFGRIPKHVTTSAELDAFTDQVMAVVEQDLKPKETK